jgi:hypothetical protein
MALGFPGLESMNRRTIRANVNPLDKCTIVSIYPRTFTETKVTLQPPTYTVPAGTYEKPGILVVESASYWVEIDAQQPLLEVPTPSITMADSIVKDWMNGLLACNMGDATPGLFYVQGKKSVEEVKKDHKSELDLARIKQDNWYKALVKLGDVMWSRTNGNPIAISDDMRFAAKELGEQREWMRDFEKIGLIRCVACGNLRDPRYPICSVCKAIADPEMAKKLNLTFAQ